MTLKLALTLTQAEQRAQSMAQGSHLQSNENFKIDYLRGCNHCNNYTNFHAEIGDRVMQY